MVNRRVTYKLYPRAEQIDALNLIMRQHRDLYNAALQERNDAWEKQGIRIGYKDQCKSLTAIRSTCPDLVPVHAQSAQVTLKRLDLAFQAFFRRARNGEEPGYPRFKSADRFPGFGFKSHGDGFRFTPGATFENGYLRISGVGWMQARGAARTPGQIKTCDIMRKVDGWFASIVIECQPHRDQIETPREAGLDWGVETFATLAYDMGDFDAFANDRLLNAEQEQIKAEQHAFALEHRGKKRTRRRFKAKRALARRHRKVANRRKNMLHQRTARLVREHALIVTEDLSIQNMTATARGTIEKPGKNVRQKAGLNRAILDTAPSGFLSLLQSKAEEADSCEILLVDPRRYRPSQTDPVDGSVRKKKLSERRHVLPNGSIITRDQASALTLLRIGLEQKGRNCPWAAHAVPKTPSWAA